MKAKDIVLRPIKSSDANKIVKALHYSGKVVSNSQIHFGVFANGKCGGALQFGPSLDKGKMMHLVEGTRWNSFIELNRMVLADWMPKNSESRSIAVALKLLKRKYQQLEWVVSYADACECGDGTIYRAAGFVLTMIKKNSDIYISEDGRKVHSMTIKSSKAKLQKHGNWKKALVAEYGACKKLEGHQLRYIYFYDKTDVQRLNSPVIPFSEIKRKNASMYLGVRGADSGTPGNQSGGGGAIPTRTL